MAGALAAPALQPTLESIRAEAAARRTAAFLDEMRRRAVLERRTITVRCKPPEGRLEAVGAAAPASFRIPESVALVSCSPEEVRFHPQGSATGMTLALRDRRGRGRLVEVGAFTGLARVAPAP